MHFQYSIYTMENIDTELWMWGALTGLLIMGFIILRYNSPKNRKRNR